MAAKRSPTPPTPEMCPVCGEDVPPRALACPECGADHRSGWREDAAVYNGVGLPEDDGEFDYDEFVRGEFGNGGGSGGRRAGLKPIWLVTAVVLLVIFVVIAFRLFFFFPF